MVVQASETENEFEESKLERNSVAGNSPLEYPVVIESEEPGQSCESESETVKPKGKKHISDVGKDKLIVNTMAQEDTVSKEKKKKFRPAENLWCFSIANHRYDNASIDHEDQIDSRYNDIASYNKKMPTHWCWDEDCELAAEIFYRGRANPGLDKRVKKCKVPKAQKQLKDIHFRVDLVKQSISGNKPPKVKSDIYSRKMQRDVRITQMIEDRKENIEKKLKKRQLERRGLKKVEVKECTAQTKTRKYRTKPRWSQERKDDRANAWEVYPYALNEQELQQADKSDPETQLMLTLMQLQHRDLTPEDYDILLQLDEKVPAKTVSMDKLKSLPTHTLTDSDLIELQHRDLTPEDYDILLQLDDKVPAKTVSMDKLKSLTTQKLDSNLTGNAAFGDPCSICMEKYAAAQTVKFLPCNHVFHELCIDNWLTNSGTKCPLDGLEVEL